MKNLYLFETKKVKIVDNEDRTFYGQVLMVQPPEDNEYNEICVDIEVKDGTIYGLLESEIKSIELVD